MVIDMNEAQVRTLQQVRQVPVGTQLMEFQAAADDRGRHAWIGSVLKRFDYPRLARTDRGSVLAYLQRLITTADRRFDIHLGNQPEVRQKSP